MLTLTRHQIFMNPGLLRENKTVELTLDDGSTVRGKIFSALRTEDFLLEIQGVTLHDPDLNWWLQSEDGRLFFLPTP
jgi:hypothetical protein